MFVDLELWVRGRWQLVARMEDLGEPEAGHVGKIALEYEIDYAKDELGAVGSHSLSCRYAPAFDLWVEPRWPAFMLDILPAGAARRSMLARMQLPDTPASDWQLLAKAQFPPGNLRVRPLAPDDATARHPGFERSEVVERGSDFVEYAFQRGAPIAGSTGAQGEAPKFLLCQGQQGRWHAEGALPDQDVAASWLVKFPRGRHGTDSTILREEARYMEIAREAGLGANDKLIYEDDCLFVPRFDRKNGERLGLETIASLSSISDYGVTQSLQRSAKAIAECCSDPQTQLCEFLIRDIFNLAVGNTDNHVRNTSVLKYPDGRVELSPLYDVAPMLLDRAGIARAGRWGARENESIDWEGVLQDLVELGGRSKDLREVIGTMSEFVGSLGERMRRHGIDCDLIERLAPRQTTLAQELSKAANT